MLFKGLNRNLMVQPLVINRLKGATWIFQIAPFDKQSIKIVYITTLFIFYIVIIFYVVCRY